jgi:mono/diheme cytochrome c family protein
MKTWSICVVLCAVFMPCVEVLAQEFKGNPANGLAIYRDYCLRCHGEALDGKGPDASSLTVAPANFHAPHSRIKSESELKMTLRRGRSLTDMHGWEDRLRTAQIVDVVAYIRSVVPQEGP